VYPIKSLRGCRLPQASLTKYGFRHDRNFVLLKILEESPQKLQHMSVSKFSTMCLFHTSFHGNKLLVSYKPPGSSIPTHEIEVPLEHPNLEQLPRVDINMYGSPNRGYVVGERYSEWFSERLGFKVIFAYWGGDARPVLGNLVPNKPRVEKPTPKRENAFSNAVRYIPFIGKSFNSNNYGGVIAFNDCAPYLVITERSAEEVTARLPESVDVDITKFRANIVLKGSTTAFEEDFWAELVTADGARIILTGNCGRCVSLNVDYETGKSGTGRDGEVLKLLSQDRRVDPGMKYSPIFGRYGFASRRSEGMVLSVGEKVAVSRKNEERTRFCEYIISNFSFWLALLGKIATDSWCIDWPDLST
jgi:uncharacterized protein YcbX